jgi:hypothetical protein
MSDSKPKPGPFLIAIAITLASIDGLIAYSIAEVKVPDHAAFHAGYMAGYVLRAIVFWPAVVVGAFQIGKRFRNPRSMLKIYCWSSLFVLLGLLAQVGAMLPKSY